MRYIKVFAFSFTITSVAVLAFPTTPLDKESGEQLKVWWCEENDLNPDDYVLVPTWYGYDFEPKEN